MVSGAIHSKIDDLVEVSARLGRNLLLVQAGSGNTSVKVDGTLWIKASGKWLAHAGREEILVPVSLWEERVPSRRPEYGSGLTPSIETAMHVVVPHAATIHVHSVNTIVWAVQEDGPELLAELLDGLPWQWIPYVVSGVPLATIWPSSTASRSTTTITGRRFIIR
jgi:rhamnose utilization protein RhaD (predicted bifunctional aldolase and dehydrogenase)